MNHATAIRIGIAAMILALLGLRSAAVLSDATFTAGSPPTIAQAPLYLRDATPPLNMLVMGKDHKIYYEAYNDASDLNGDGSLDVGYRGWELKSPAPPAGVLALQDRLLRLFQLLRLLYLGRHQVHARHDARRPSSAAANGAATFSTT